MSAIAKTIIFKSFGALCLNYCPLLGGVIWNNDGRSYLIIAYFIQMIGTIVRCQIWSLRKVVLTMHSNNTTLVNYSEILGANEKKKVKISAGSDRINQACQITRGNKESFNRPLARKKQQKARMDQRHFVYSSQRSNVIVPTSHNHSPASYNWKRYWSADVDVVDLWNKFSWIK